MDEQGVIAALTADRQIDQLRLRGIKNDAGHAYNPSYYKRGLNNAIERGGLAVADYVRGYLYKPPSDGYKKPEIAHALDLACEWLDARRDEALRGPVHGRRPSCGARPRGGARRSCLRRGFWMAQWQRTR